VAEQSKTVDSALTLLTLLADGDSGGRTDDGTAGGGDTPATHRPEDRAGDRSDRAGDQAGPVPADGAATTAAALARTLGLSRSAVARLLATLEAHGLARRTGQGWGPGLGLLALAAGVEPRLRSLARHELGRLAARFGETAVLCVREGDEVVAIDQVVGDGGVVQIHYRTGTRHPVDVGAGGRALLVAHPAEAVFTEGELEPGVRGVAAAVVDAGGVPVASIAVVAPVHRFPPGEAVAPAVVDAARRVSAGLATPAPDPRPEGGRDAVLPPRG
jgi:DNA-binding IclR family transcriptional regulator